MDVRNCRRCRAIFNYVVGPQICPQCREQIEAKFQEVKNYVYANKRATVPVISKECNVEMSQIHAWIREERLVFADDSPIGIGCELCGTMIKTGRFCAKCKTEVTNNLNSAISKNQSAVAPALKKQERDPAKMRFL